MRSVDWTDRVSNEEVLQRVENNLTVSQSYQRTSSKIDRHVMRVDTLLKDMLKGTIRGKQQIGRTRCKTRDWMMNIDNGIFISEVKRNGKVQKNMERWWLKPVLGRRT